MNTHGTITRTRSLWRASLFLACLFAGAVAGGGTLGAFVSPLAAVSPSLEVGLLIECENDKCGTGVVDEEVIFGCVDSGALTTGCDVGANNESCTTYICGVTKK